MCMTFSVAVAGCTGYAGAEVIRLLLGHPKARIGALTAGASAGTRLGDAVGHLVPLADRVVGDTTPENLRGHDVVVLALPHGESARIAAEMDDATLVVDCAADHRLTDEASWRAFYPGEYAEPWPYGLPEMPGQRDILATARRIAVPGCYVTTVTLGLLPAIVDGLIGGRDVTVAAASGTSGAGKSAKTHLLLSEATGSMSAYGVGGTHRHIPEILQNLCAMGAADPTISFTPMLAPMARGILAVITAPIDPSVTEEQVAASYRDHYDAEPFVRVLPAGQWPASKWVVGSNGVLVQATIDRAAGRLVVISTLDNLTKGTAGGAVQSMNIALGLEETTGLDAIGLAP